MNSSVRNDFRSIALLSCSCFCVEASAQADFSIESSLSPTPLVAGASSTLAFAIRNNGPEVTGGYLLVDFAPPVTAANACYTVFARAGAPCQRDLFCEDLATPLPCWRVNPLAVGSATTCIFDVTPTRTDCPSQTYQFRIAPDVPEPFIQNNFANIVLGLGVPIVAVPTLQEIGAFALALLVLLLAANRVAIATVSD